MSSLKIADFLFSRIQETIAFKTYIKEVEISYQLDGTFGNRYVRLSYEVEINEAFDKLSYDEKEIMFNSRPNYTFTLSTHKESTRDVEHKETLRLMEFRHIYESLAAYAVLQLEHNLLPGTVIKAQGIDLCPYTNYAEKYIYTALKSAHYRTMYARDQDIWQWKELHELARQSRQVWLKHKECFSITDIELHQLPWINLSEVRSILISYKVPVKIRGIKTINEIRIHLPSLIESIKKELDSEYAIRYRKAEYEALITYLYDHYMPAKKTEIICHQQADFLRQLIIQKGDILELKDGRIVVTDSLFFDGQDNIGATYLIMKTNLETGNRSRTIGVDDIAYVLKKQEFRSYLDHIPFRHLSLLRKWMLQRKKEVGHIIFKPDLTRQLPIENPAMLVD